MNYIISSPQSCLRVMASARPLSDKGDAAFQARRHIRLRTRLSSFSKAAEPYLWATWKCPVVEGQAA